MDEQLIKKYLKTLTTDDFAEHILRNYSFGEWEALGSFPIEQAYAVLCIGR